MGLQNILSIDAAGKRVRGVLAIPPSFNSDCLTSLPDRSKVYVAATSLYEINVADNSFRRMPAGGICFRSVAASRREPGVIYALGERACGGRPGQGLVRYSVPDGKVLLERELPYEVWHAGGVTRLILSAQEDTGYLGTCAAPDDRGYGKLHVLDLKTLEVTASCDIDYGVTDFVLREDTRRIYTIGYWSAGGAPGRLPVTEWDIPSRAVTRQMFFDKCSDLRAMALDPTDPRIAWYTEGDPTKSARWTSPAATRWRPGALTPATALDRTRSPPPDGEHSWAAGPGFSRSICAPARRANSGVLPAAPSIPAACCTTSSATGLPHTTLIGRPSSARFNSAARSIRLGGTPVGDAVAFVDCESGMIARNLVVVDAASGQPRKVIPLPALPAGHRVIVSPEGNKAYVPIGNTQSTARILVYDTATWDVRADINVPRRSL